MFRIGLSKQRIVAVAFVAIATCFPGGVKAQSVSFSTGSGGPITPTGPAAIPGTNPAAFRVVRIGPGPREDIVLGMFVFPTSTTPVPVRVLRPPGNGTLIDATGTVITGGFAGCAGPGR